MNIRFVGWLYEQGAQKAGRLPPGGWELAGDRPCLLHRRVGGVHTPNLQGNLAVLILVEQVTEVARSTCVASLRAEGTQ